MVQAETALPETGQFLKSRNSLLTTLEIRQSKILVLTSGEHPVAVLLSQGYKVPGANGVLLKSLSYRGGTPFVSTVVI